jgi:hypothetical protein
MYTYTYIYTYIHAHIYIYREREREITASRKNSIASLPCPPSRPPRWSGSAQKWRVRNRALSTQPALLQTSYQDRTLLKFGQHLLENKSSKLQFKSFLSAIQGWHDFSQNFLPIMCPKALSRMMFLLVPYSIIVNWLSVPNPCVCVRERERERVQLLSVYTNFPCFGVLLCVHVGYTNFV